MRKVRVFVSLLVLGLLNTGCIIAMDIKDYPYRKQVVSAEGELYVVDPASNRVRMIDAKWKTNVETISEVSVDVVDD